MKKLSFSMENYLEAIYELSSENQGVRLTDIAERMGVTKASANNAMAVLAEKGLVDKEKYQEVFLTPHGIKLAKFTSQKHHTLEEFFIRILKINPKIANKDACAIEHVISDDIIYAMQDYLAGHSR